MDVQLVIKTTQYMFWFMVPVVAHKPLFSNTAYAPAPTSVFMWPRVLTVQRCRLVHVHVAADMY